MNRPRGLSLSLALLASLASATLAETPPFEVPTTSPSAVVSQRIAATDVEISYHRPSRRGREIFGALVPYGQVWRTGADRATRITFSTPVTLGGEPVAAGTYELFTVPGEREWAVILQSDRSQWGSYGYDPEHDAARIAAHPDRIDKPVETLTLSVDDLGSSSGQLRIAWDQTRISVPIEVDVEATVVPRLEEALESAERPPYFRAAMFYFENDLDLGRAAELMDRALEAAPDHIGMLYRKALILERKGDVDDAIAAAERSLAGAAAANPELRDEYTRLNTALLQRLRAMSTS